MYSKYAWVALATLVPAILSQYSTDEESGSQPELNLDVLISHQSPPNPISMRLPTVVTNATIRNWEHTPPGWFFGTWYFTHSNQASYQEFRNMQWTISRHNPNANDDTLNDLTTFQLLDSASSTVWELYGVDTPVVLQGVPQRDAYLYQPTGGLAPDNNEFEFLAWGYDGEGVPWFVMSETLPGGSTTLGAFDIVSRSDKGPSEETMEMIRHAVVQLGNRELAALMKNSTKLVQDGGRNGQLWPACNATCQTNVYNPFGL